MKIKNIEVKKFKRFTDLKIENIPASAKLVVLIGQNGCGKSSLFDAFDRWLRNHRGQLGDLEPNYYIKEEFKDIQNLHVYNFVKIYFHDFDVTTDHVPKLLSFYIRSAYRNEPSFELNQLNRMELNENENIILQNMISNDIRVSRNYQLLVADSIEELYSKGNDDTTKIEIRERLIGKIRESMKKLFPELTFIGVGNPLRDGTFYFEKGESKNFKYMNLSSGEKACFDLILDLILKSTLFNDTVFCIDEPALHMHTKLQGKLLEVLYELLPPNCQLWIASHEIGMMNKAKELYEADNGAVIFLDFANRDFDQPVIIEPAKINKELWRRTLDVALDEMANLVAPKRIVVCEGDPSATKNKEFDAQCFSGIFSDEFPDSEFISLGNTRDVIEKSKLLLSYFNKFVSGIEIVRLIDRDLLSPAEVAIHKTNGVQVLSRRHIESFLFDDEVLKALCGGDLAKETEVLSAKADRIASSVSRGNDADDIKSASDEIRSDLRRILGLTGCGSTHHAFCQAILCPMIKPGTRVYDELRNDIFGV